MCEPFEEVNELKKLKVCKYSIPVKKRISIACSNYTQSISNLKCKNLWLKMDKIIIQIELFFGGLLNKKSSRTNCLQHIHAYYYFYTF